MTMTGVGARRERRIDGRRARPIMLALHDLRRVGSPEKRPARHEQQALAEARRRIASECGGLIALSGRRAGRVSPTKRKCIFLHFLLPGALN